MTLMSPALAASQLRQVPMFRAMSEGALARLASIARVRTLAPETVLFRQGDPGDEMVILLTGALRVTAKSGDAELCLAVAEPGEVLGEMSLIDGAPRSASVTADEDCTLMSLDRETFLALLREEPDIAISVLQCMTERLRQTSEHATDIAHLDIYQRLLRQLRRMACDHGEHTADGVRIRHRVSSETLSKMIAVRRDAVERFLASLEADGVLHRDNDHITVTDLDRLTAQATPLLY